MTSEYKTKDLAHLIERVDSRASFGFASRNFYACFLAALNVEKNADLYFGKVAWAKPLEAQDLKLPAAAKFSQLVKWFDGDSWKAQLYNPHLTSKVIRNGHSIPLHTVISIPKNKYNLALLSLGRRGRSIASEDKRSR
jgi:membrane-bound lytic murein transglycosylase D